MTIERKLLGTSPSGGGATDVADVFSTYLWAGNGGSQTITNGIDLAGEGGMVWIKNRTSSSTHSVHDTERGVHNAIRPDTTHASGSQDPYGVSAFNSNGFSYGSGGHNNNQTGQDYVSWTFRKKKKFFDVVTYSGNGVTGRQIAHNLGGPVGMILIRSTNTSNDWQVWHTTTGAAGAMQLNTTAAVNNSVYWWNNTNPTSTHFTLAARNQSNNSDAVYVAYLFADNSSEDADDQMIKCGGYTGNASTLQDINLGWEPQFLIVKDSSASGGWYMWDSMRGWLGGANNGDGHPLYTNQASAEFNNDDVGLLSNGFQVADALNTNSNSYIYMAIRAPMMVEPEAATDVFSLTNATGAVIHNVGLVPDMAIWTNTASSGNNRQIGSRLIGDSYLRTNTSAAASNAGQGWDEKTGYWQNPNHASNINLLWKRAKGFFDVVAYSGTGSARTIPHSLGVAPEMIWAKKRNNSRDWGTGFASQGWTKRGPALDQNETSYVTSVLWNNTAPTDSVFSVSGLTHINGSGDTYIAYLFATLAGISKVGSYTGNGSSQTINCGFSAGARFVLIKRTNATGSWMVFDTARGIVAGNDPYFYLDSSSAHITDEDAVDPHSSGFIINQTNGDQNVSGSTYIFYAIA